MKRDADGRELRIRERLRSVRRDVKGETDMTTALERRYRGCDWRYGTGWGR